jgi:hypothetical protein
MSNETPYVIGAGMVRKDGAGVAIIQVEELAEQGSVSSSIGLRIPTSTNWTMLDIEELPVAIGRVESNSNEWEFVTVDGTHISSEKIHKNQEFAATVSPSRKPVIRSGRLIGQTMFIAGMNRQVFCKGLGKPWASVDQGTVIPKGDLRVVGFNAIDGVDENDLYACGFLGEIWRCQKTVWKQLSSPTNVILHALRVVKPDLAFAAGQRGVLLQGNGDDWDQIDHQETEDDIWGLEWFQDTLYVATAKKLYTLTKDRTLAPVKTGLGKKATHRELHTNGKVLWSFGSKTVAYTEDGTTWHDVTP